MPLRDIITPLSLRAAAERLYACHYADAAATRLPPRYCLFDAAAPLMPPLATRMPFRFEYDDRYAATLR